MFGKQSVIFAKILQRLSEDNFNISQCINLGRHLKWGTLPTDKFFKDNRLFKESVKLIKWVKIPVKIAPSVLHVRSKLFQFTILNFSG